MSEQKTTTCTSCGHGEDVHTQMVGCVARHNNGAYCTCQDFQAIQEPSTPYAGTSGWSGSDTSRERAERDDSDGTTADRQQRVLAILARLGAEGTTWKELAAATDWHHGQASGALSVLHKVGKVARLTERRNRCQVYVLPEHVNGRDTAPHGRRAPQRVKPSENPEVQRIIGEAIGAGSMCWESMSGTGMFQSDQARAVLDNTLAELDRVL